MMMILFKLVSLRPEKPGNPHTLQEGKETALSSTRMTSGSHPEERASQKPDDPEEPGISGDSEAPPATRTIDQEQQPSGAPANPMSKNRACILPLYEWLSLGDGAIGAVDTAIGCRSVSGQFSSSRNSGCAQGDKIRLKLV